MDDDGNLAYNKNGNTKGQVKQKWSSARHMEEIWTLPALADNLDSCKSLLSPSDPQQKRENDKEFNRTHKDQKNGWGGNRLHRRAQSYAFCLSGDLLLGDTIMTLTRNIAGDGKRKNNKYGFIRGDRKVFAAAKQKREKVGSDKYYGIELVHSSSGKWADPIAESATKNGKYFCISGLDANQGNHALADGSTTQGSDADIAADIAKHMKATGGTLTEQSSGAMRPTYH